MLAVVGLLAGSFTFLIWNSYRTARLRAAQATSQAGDVIDSVAHDARQHS